MTAWDDVDGWDQADSRHSSGFAVRAEQQIAATQFLIALLIVALELQNWLRHSQQFSTMGQVLRAVAIGEKPVVADALKIIWKHMQQETPQELIGGQRHQLLLVLVLVILVDERDLCIPHFFQTVIGDCDPMRVAAQVIQNPFRAAERRFGIDNPFTVAERRQIADEVPRIVQWLQFAIKLQFSGRIGLLQVTQIKVSETAREYAHR